MTKKLFGTFISQGQFVGATLDSGCDDRPFVTFEAVEGADAVRLRMSRQDVLLDRNDLKWIKELITKFEEEACW